jgi:hypothetical protein
MAAPLTVEALVSHFQLQAHPEGGFFRETFRDPNCIAREALPGCSGDRSRSTAILFLLPSGCVSKLHRIRFAECWHFYSGDALTVVELDEAAGQLRRTVLGSNVLAGEQLQHVVPGGRWFGAMTHEDAAGSAGFSLVGCTVAPGFDFADFQLLSDGELMLSRFPADAAETIRLLTS